MAVKSGLFPLYEVLNGERYRVNARPDGTDVTEYLRRQRRYVRSTAPANRVGTWAFAGLVTFLIVIYFLSVFGPPPPSVTAIAYGGLAMWLIIAWGYWVDRNRTAKP